MLPNIRPTDPPSGIPLARSFTSKCNRILSPVKTDPYGEFNLHQYLLARAGRIISGRYMNYMNGVEPQMNTTTTLDRPQLAAAPPPPPRFDVSPIFSTISEASLELRSSRVSSVPLDSGSPNPNVEPVTSKQTRPVDPLRFRRRIKTVVRALRTLHSHETQFRRLPLGLQYRGMRLLEIECQKMGLDTPDHLHDFLEQYFNKRAKRL
ncbi:unnamed protein product [Absidia cylindrospora]